MDLKDFEAVYSRRMELMESKNEKKAKEMLRKAEIADRIRKEVSKQIEAKKETQKHVGTGTKESTEPRITQIRYLVFRNWSGDHLNYNINDNGYKYRFPNGVAALVKHLLEENGFCEGNNEGLIVWNVGVVASSIYQTLGAYHKINHFPKSFEITRKDLMLQNLSKMQSKHGINYKYFPRTFILPAEGVQFM